jgi:hypothetical protein
MAVLPDCRILARPILHNIGSLEPFPAIDAGPITQLEYPLTRPSPQPPDLKIIHFFLESVDYVNYLMQNRLAETVRMACK